MNDETETKRVTGRELADAGLAALDVTHYAQMPVEHKGASGEIGDVDWMKILELGKALAAMKEGMPAHVRGAWGIGCRIATNAFNWKMDPFAIADQTYVVNNRLGYMSQLIHALINRAAPLMHRLECEYIGEGQERQCRVTGQFISGDEREYITPKLKDIKPKNSPLWVNDADQQQWYYGVRAWGRKWVPEVMLGVYTKEELEADKSLGYEDTAPGLHARLKGSAPAEEGHQIGHAAEQLDEIENGGSTGNKAAQTKASPSASAGKAQGQGRAKGKGAKRASELPRAKATPKHSDTAASVSRETTRGSEATKVTYPSNVAEYLAYARRWIKAEPSKVVLGERWASERKLRNQLGVTAEDRAPLEDLMQKMLAK